MSLPTHPLITAADFAEFKSRLKGEAFTREDLQYEQARQAWNRSVDQHPVVIVAAETASDVVEAVKFARRAGLGVAVQSTGHGITLPADDALLVLTARLKDLQVDPIGDTARIGAGLKWGEVLASTQVYGLAPLMGSSGDVGVMGYTLGGGLGWLARKHGLALDSVLSFEVVNPDGELLTASETENADLFWALRGGGSGGFGVVTAMHIRLYPVDKVYAGNLYYPAEMAADVMKCYREWIKAAPDALTTSVVLMNYPPLPMVPEPLRGKSFVIVRGCYIGSMEDGEMLMQTWRAWRKPVIDDFKPMPFREADRISNDPVDPMPAKTSGAWMNELSDEAIETLIRFGLPQGGPPLLAFVEVRHAGGAVSRVEPQTNAFGHRSAPLVVVAIAMTPTPEAYTQVENHLDRMLEALGPALTGGVYMNFVDGREAHRRTPDGFTAEKFQRLQSLKMETDPDNLFRYGYNLFRQK